MPSSSLRAQIPWWGTLGFYLALILSLVCLTIGVSYVLNVVMWMTSEAWLPFIVGDLLRETLSSSLLGAVIFPLLEKHTGEWGRYQNLTFIQIVTRTVRLSFLGYLFHVACPFLVGSLLLTLIPDLLLMGVLKLMGWQDWTISNGLTGSLAESFINFFNNIYKVKLINQPPKLGDDHPIKPALDLKGRPFWGFFLGVLLTPILNLAVLSGLILSVWALPVAIEMVPFFFCRPDVVLTLVSPLLHVALVLSTIALAWSVVRPFVFFFLKNQILIPCEVACSGFKANFFYAFKGASVFDSSFLKLVLMWPLSVDRWIQRAAGRPLFGLSNKIQAAYFDDECSVSNKCSAIVLEPECAGDMYEENPFGQVFHHKTLPGYENWLQSDRNCGQSGALIKEEKDSAEGPGEVSTVENRRSLDA